jgi:hypothetical protein
MVGMDVPCDHKDPKRCLKFNPALGLGLECDRVFQRNARVELEFDEADFSLEITIEGTNKNVSDTTYRVQLKDQGEMAKFMRSVLAVVDSKRSPTPTSSEAVGPGLSRAR